MKKLFLVSLLLGLICGTLFADNNNSRGGDHNNSDANVSVKKKILEKQVEEQIKREEKHGQKQLKDILISLLNT